MRNKTTTSNCLSNNQGLEPLRTLDFVGFQEPVLVGTLILKKGFQNRFLGTLNFEKVPEPVLWNPKFLKMVPEPVLWSPKFVKRDPVRWNPKF
jgi:hypothetical protein